jgi:hypothetical protein
VRLKGIILRFLRLKQASKELMIVMEEMIGDRNKSILTRSSAVLVIVIRELNGGSIGKAEKQYCKIQSSFSILLHCIYTIIHVSYNFC